MMGLAGFGKGFSAGYDKGEKMKDRKRNRVQARGADGATGAGVANTPDKKLANQSNSMRKGTAKGVDHSWDYKGKGVNK